MPSTFGSLPCYPQQKSSIRLFASASSPEHEERTQQPPPPPEETSSSFFSSHITSFPELGVQSPVLMQRVQDLGLTRPTTVQAAAFEHLSQGCKAGDVTIGAETGSGKTLAYLLPLMDDILQRKQKQVQQQQNDDDHDSSTLGYDYCRAVILVPNKELVQQVLRMATPLAMGTPNQEHDTQEDDAINTIRLAVLPGGLQEPTDFRPFRESIAGIAPPVDLVLGTPASMALWGTKPKFIDLFADIETLVIDEADMLLDGGYIRALEDVLMGFRRADRLQYAGGALADGWKKTQHVFVAATLPDAGLRSVDAYLQRRFPRATRVAVQGMHRARHSGLREQTVWIHENSKKGRMERLVQLLNTPTTTTATATTAAAAEEESSSVAGLQGEKVMVFVNTVENVDGACEALVLAGINAVPYHAKIPQTERILNMDRFRRYQPVSESGTEPNDERNDDDTVPVLVCSDLASRGIDVPGVTAVVQLEFATNVVAHLHRMGRSGRAGQHTGGRGIVFYGDVEEPLARVVQQAEQEQDQVMSLQGNDVIELERKDDEDDEADVTTSDGDSEAVAGSVQNAFSRKRGFTKKRKKLRRETEPAE